MTKLGKIYLISNDVNSKVYVGQTIQSLNKRFTGHCCYSKSDKSANMYIKRAIHKYGKDKFHITLIEECPINLLNDREKYWISFYDSYNSGYNLTKGGQDSNYFNLHRLEDTIDTKKCIAWTDNRLVFSYKFQFLLSLEKIIKRRKILLTTVRHINIIFLFIIINKPF